MLPNISRIKGNQTFGQLTEYNKRNISLQKLCWKWGRKPVPDHFLFYKTALYEVKASNLQFSFNVFRYPSTCIKLQTIDSEIYLIYIRKKFGTSFFTTNTAWLWQKILLIEQISLSGCLYFLSYWVIFVSLLLVSHIAAS